MHPMKRSGLKLFGLCVLAVGLIAFSASAAQTPSWMVKGKNLITADEAEALEVNLLAPNVKLLGTLGLNKVTFSCTGGILVNAELESDGAISETAESVKVKFSGCSTEIGGKVSTACEPLSGTEKGVIETEEGYASLASHKLSETEKDGVIVITPATGNVFAIIHMNLSCSISETVQVFGELAVKDSGGNASLEEEKKAHTFEEFAPLTNLTIANSESKAKATLDGKAEVKLTSGEVWSGLA